MALAETRQAGALSQFREVSLDKVADLLCAYDPENDHPRGVVFAILEAMVGLPQSVRDRVARTGPLR